MADQEARKGLDKDYPVRDYDYYKKKYTKKGYTGDKLLEKIRNGAKNLGSKKTRTGTYDINLNRIGD